MAAPLPLTWRCWPSLTVSLIPRLQVRTCSVHLLLAFSLPALPARMNVFTILQMSCLHRPHALLPDDALIAEYVKSGAISIVLKAGLYPSSGTAQTALSALGKLVQRST